MTDKNQTIPTKQFAVQLTGPSELKLNPAKEVTLPGPHQILAKIGAVGLCFSDLKLLKQFDKHPRKGPIVSGIKPEILDEIPSYVPFDAPTVPGHEAICRIVAVGDKVKHHKLGELCLIQTDYRSLRTDGSCAAFGYNFEGALQQYVLMDERVIIDPKSSRRFLIPVDEDLSAAAVCLVEPWACVEESYVIRERQTILADGKLLVVAQAGAKIKGLAESFSPQGLPKSITVLCDDDSQRQDIAALSPEIIQAADAQSLPDEGFDDVVYFGSSKKTIDALNDKIAPRGIINIVTAGAKIGQAVSVGVGRIHYGMTRWIGTNSPDASESYKTIPSDGQIRPGENIVVVGAGGPMGQMHVIRAVCSRQADIKVTATDFDDARLESLRKKADPPAQANGIDLRTVNPSNNPLDEKFSYYAVMVPVGAIVAAAIDNSTDNCLINIFAGIPAPTREDLDMDTYIDRRGYMFGTSGSSIEDMEIVLANIRSGQLDTNCSVDAISGMAGAIEGISAVENRTLAGKIIVYPQLPDVGLIALSDLDKHYPAVAAKLNDGIWTKAAEDELLKTKHSHPISR